MTESLNGIQAIHRLTPMQSGMLFHSLKSPDTGVFVQQICARLAGSVDEILFDLAWQQAVKQFPALRTAFVWDGVDEPLQVVRAEAIPQINFLDWRSLTDSQQASEWNELLATDRARGFAVDDAPLMRVTLARTAENTCRMLWTFHHLILDGWSTPTVLRSVFAFYEAVTTRQEFVDESAGDESPFRYRDYAAWIENRNQFAAESFWSALLTGATPPARLAIREIGAGENYGPQQPAQRQAVHGETGQVSTQLTQETTDRIQQFASNERLTVNSVVNAAWALLLSHRTDSAWVTHGVTVAGRPPSVAGIDKAVGMFVNSLPVPCRIDTNETVRNFLQRIQTLLVRLREFEHCGLSEIREYCDLPAQDPLFETLVAYENYPDVFDVQSRVESNDVPTLHDLEYLEKSDVPLVLVVIPGERIQVDCVFQRTRFAADGIAGLISQFLQILTQFCDHPTQKLAALELVPPAELRVLKRQPADHSSAPPVRTASSPTDVAVSRKQEQSVDAGTFPQTLHGLFEVSAEARPQEIAVQCDRRNWTYSQLNSLANTLAAEIRRLTSVAPTQRIGICCDRSSELVLAMLAILKSGHAFVPIDPANPQAYCNEIVNECNLSCLLTLPEFAARFSSDVTTLVLSADAISGWLADSAAADGSRERDTQDGDSHAVAAAAHEAHAVHAGDAAYTIFTSGSTGRPRGVVVSHRSIVHSTLARRDVYRQSPERFLLLSNVAFDSGLAGIFWTLMEGGTLILPPPGIEQDLSRLLDAVVQNKVTHTLCLPTLYSLLLEHPRAAELETLQTVIVAGEACTAKLVNEHVSRRHATAAMYNEYGPTEAAVWATVAKLWPPVLPNKSAEETPGDSVGSAANEWVPAPDETIPIGRPVPGMRVLILNSQQQPVAAGVIGEIYLAGPQLADGYLHATDETSARFFPLAIKGEPPQRVYRTGDIGWYRLDGTIIFAGRTDQQLKRRGFRVETTSIETELRKHPSVRDVAAIVRSRGIPPREDNAGPERSVVTTAELCQQLDALPAAQAETLLARVERASDAIVTELTGIE